MLWSAYSSWEGLLQSVSNTCAECRERKKAKLQSQSKDVEDLTQQMQDYEGLNAGVRAMETRKTALEQDLWAKEAEIERIKYRIFYHQTWQLAWIMPWPVAIFAQRELQSN